jgi:hypothetical protein
MTWQVTIATLLSTIQYFDLAKKCKELKRTMAKTLHAMITFGLVFLLIFLNFVWVGHMLLGERLHRFHTLQFALFACFDMMNANLPFEDIEPAGEDSELMMASVVFYFYAFTVSEPGDTPTVPQPLSPTAPQPPTAPHSPPQLHSPTP